MTIVPKQADLLDKLIELEQRNAMTERGCGDGGTTDPVDPGGGDVPITDPELPPDPDQPPVKQTVVRDVIVNLVAARRASGRLVFAGGTFPKVGESKIVGVGVDLETYKADTVRFEGLHRWWRRSASSRGNGVAVGQRMFALPPGWWPIGDVERQVPSGRAGAPATVRVEAATGLVRYVAGPNYPPGIDLSQFGQFQGGGGACPGFDPVDPTSAGDGRQWDCCENPGVDDAIDPIVDPAVGGDGFSGSWEPVAAAGAAADSAAEASVRGDMVFLAGSINLTNGALPNPVVVAGSVVPYDTVRVGTLPASCKPAAAVVFGVDAHDFWGFGAGLAGSDNLSEWGRVILHVTQEGELFVIGGYRYDGRGFAQPQLRLEGAHYRLH